MKIYAYRGKNNLYGERIRLARVKNRITQSDLAARMQVAGITYRKRFDKHGNSIYFLWNRISSKT